MADALGTLSSQGATRTVTHVHPFAAKSVDLWDALTLPDQIAPWMRTTQMVLEPHVGGNVHFVWSPDSDSRGTVMMFEPRKTLAYTWHEGRDHSMVRFDLKEDGDETVVTLRHRDLTPEQLPSIAAGWHTHLEFLAAVLAHQPFEFDPRFDHLLAVYKTEAAAL